MDDRQGVSGLTYKTHENPADDTAAAWRRWIKDQIAYEFRCVDEAIGRIFGQHRSDVKRELDLLRREYAVLKEEVLIESKLTSLREAIPSIPDIQSGLEAKIDALTTELRTTRTELTAARDTISTLRMKVCQAEFEITDVDKRLMTLMRKPEVKVVVQTPPEILLEAKHHEPPFRLPNYLVIEHKANGQTPQN